MEQNIRSNAVWKKFATLLFVLSIVIAALFTGREIGSNGGSEVSFFDTMLEGGMTGWNVLSFFLIGFLAGVVGGMLGMGGGVALVEVMHLFLDFDIIFVRIVSLLSFAVISFSAFWRYRKYGLILWGVVNMLIPSSILGVLIGAIIATRINQGVLEIIVAIYALFTGVIVLNQIWSNPDEKEIYDLSQNGVNEATTSMIGVEMGFVSILTGISGGIISTPLQNSLLKLPLKNSIANTIVTAVFCSITASAILLFSGLNNGDFVLGDVVFVTTFLIPGNLLGGQVGGFLTKSLGVNYVRAAFAIIAFLIGFEVLLQY